MIRPKDVPFLNGGELSVIIPSWKIRVRPVLVTYPDGNTFYINKSTVIDFSEFQVDVPGSERWVVVYFDNESKTIKTFGDIQNFFLSGGLPSNADIKLFHNKQIFILGDVKLRYGLKYLKPECVTYERRCAFMLSSSGIFIDGNWISDYIQGWNDGTAVYGRDGLMGFSYIAGGPKVPVETSDMVPLSYRVNILSFTAGASDIIDFDANPMWRAGQIFYVTRCHDVRNYGSYEVVSSVGATYTVNKLMAPAMVTDAVPIGEASLASNISMDQIYMNKSGEDYVKLIGNSSVAAIRVYGSSRDDHLFYVEHGGIKYLAAPGLSRCHSSDTPNCQAPDTSTCGASNDWSVIATEEACFAVCDANCQVAAETVCQVACETSCECSRENGVVPPCHYLDYAHGIMKCNAVLQTPKEDGQTCFSCMVSCDTVTACHVIGCTPCDTVDTCILNQACADHVCAACQNACQQLDEMCSDVAGGDTVKTVSFGSANVHAGLLSIPVGVKVICAAASGNYDSSGNLKNPSGFASAIKATELPGRAYSIWLGRSADKIKADFTAKGWSLAEGVTHLITSTKWQIMFAGIKASDDFTVVNSKYVEICSTERTDYAIVSKFKIKDGLSVTDLIYLVEHPIARSVRIQGVHWIIQAYMQSANKFDVHLPDFASIVINPGGDVTKVTVDRKGFSPDETWDVNRWQLACGGTISAGPSISLSYNHTGTNAVYFDAQFNFSMVSSTAIRFDFLLLGGAASYCNPTFGGGAIPATKIYSTTIMLQKAAGTNVAWIHLTVDGGSLVASKSFNVNGVV